MATEHEVKLGAPAGFVLPPLDGVIEGVTAAARSPRTLLAIYHDTPDLRLARWGVTVRHRSVDGSGWQVKLPEGQDGSALVRRELIFVGSVGTVPDAVWSLELVYESVMPLVIVARYRTV